MIFVTVGDSMPFDRLVLAVDTWAGDRGRDDVLAQIGMQGTTPRHIRWVRRMPPAEFRSTIRRAGALVAHAGMGTILTALTFGIPLLVYPRRGDLRETLNDHQVATARHFASVGAVEAAFDQAELFTQLDRLSTLAAGKPIRPHASDRLLEALKAAVR